MHCVCVCVCVCLDQATDHVRPRRRPTKWPSAPWWPSWRAPFRRCSSWWLCWWSPSVCAAAECGAIRPAWPPPPNREARPSPIWPAAHLRPRRPKRCARPPRRRALSRGRRARHRPFSTSPKTTAIPTWSRSSAVSAPLPFTSCAPSRASKKKQTNKNDGLIFILFCIFFIPPHRIDAHQNDGVFPVYHSIWLNGWALGRLFDRIFLQSLLNSFRLIWFTLNWFLGPLPHHWIGWHLTKRLAASSSRLVRFRTRLTEPFPPHWINVRTWPPAHQIGSVSRKENEPIRDDRIDFWWAIFPISLSRLATCTKCWAEFYPGS